MSQSTAVAVEEGGVLGLSAPARRRALALVVTCCGIVMMAAVTPTTVTLALHAQRIAAEHKEAVLSLVLSVGTLVAVVANPVAGHLSDRATSGLRSPWLLGGALCGVGGTVLIPLAPNVPAMVAGWCVAQLGFNVTFAALYGVLADLTTAEVRGRTFGFIGVSQSLGIMAGTWIADLVAPSMSLMFALPPLAALASVLLLVFGVPSCRRRPVDRASRFSGFRFPLRARNFAWAWSGRFLVMVGNSIFAGYQLYYLTEHQGVAVSEATAVIAASATIGAVAQLVSSPLGGWLSDRSGRRKVWVGIGTVLFAVGLALIAFAPGVPVFLAASGLANLAYGLYRATNMAMVVDVLPDGGARAAKDLGIFSVASTLGLLVGPALVPLILAFSGGYTVVFLVASGFVVAAAFTLTPITGVR